MEDDGLIGMRTDLEVNDRVYHVPEPDAYGTVVEVEDNRLSVMVQWDDNPAGSPDFQWANKVARLDPAEDPVHKCGACAECVYTGGAWRAHTCGRDNVTIEVMP